MDEMPTTVPLQYVQENMMKCPLGCKETCKETRLGDLMGALPVDKIRWFAASLYMKMR